MEPEVIDGIKCYAPEKAFVNDGFDPASFNSLYQLEENNFWFRCRTRIIKSVLTRYLRKNDTNKFLEIGCGTGIVLKGISELKNIDLTGSEIYLEGIKKAKDRLDQVEIIQLDATRLPFKEEWHGIGAFDVLEHIEEDQEVFRQVYKSLKMGGIFLITVPQYSWMWSDLDDFSHHKRRYSRNLLTNRFTEAGFRMHYIGSFVFTIFPILALSRFTRKWFYVPQNENRETDYLAEFKIPAWFNKLLELLLRIDELLIDSNLSLPWGGSLIAVGFKPLPT